MPQTRLDIQRRPAASVAKDVHDLFKDHKGDSDWELVLRIGETADPKRVLKVLTMSLGDRARVRLVIRHADLREYLEHAAIGGLAGASALIATSMLAGHPVAIGALATAFGLGAVIGLAVAPITVAEVYRYRGVTYLRMSSEPGLLNRAFAAITG